MSNSMGMTKSEYIEFHRAACDRMIDITARKNKDYTGDSVDPFANFRMVEKLGVTDTARGMLVRMSDKFVRICNLIDGRQAQVKDEAIEDTLLDLANYSILMMGYLRASRDSSTPSSETALVQKARVAAGVPELGPKLRVGGKYRSTAGFQVSIVAELFPLHDGYQFVGDDGCFYGPHGELCLGEATASDLVWEVAE